MVRNHLFPERHIPRDALLRKDREACWYNNKQPSQHIKWVRRIIGIQNDTILQAEFHKERSKGKVLV